MTALLIPPGHNTTPRAVVRTAPGMVALDATCVTPAVRWYTLASLEAVNGGGAVAAALAIQDNILALTEILGTRNPERQASRDLYVYELGYQIAEAVAA